MLSVLLNHVSDCWYIAVIATICLCSGLSSAEWPIQKQIQSERKVDRLIDSASRSIERKYAVERFGSGAKMFQGPIREVGLSFTVVGPLSIPELRRLLIACAHETLAAARSIPDLSCYVAEPPFSLQNIVVTVFQIDRDGRDLAYPVYDVGSIGRGELEYLATDPRPEIDANPYKTRFSETYEQALEAMRKEYEQCQQDSNAGP